MFSKKVIVTAMLGAICVAVCQIAGAPAAQAEIDPGPNPVNTIGTMSAMAGFGWPNAARDCFWNSWSLTRNSCTDTQTFLLPFHVSMAQPPPDASSLVHPLTVRVRGYGSTTEKVSCKLIVNTINNGARFGATLSTQTASRSYQWLGYVTGQDFPIDTSSAQLDILGEVAHLECSVAKDVGIVSVTYYYD